MFSQNGKRPISVEFRGCFPHAKELNITHPVSYYFKALISVNTLEISSILVAL